MSIRHDGRPPIVATGEADQLPGHPFPKESM